MYVLTISFADNREQEVHYFTVEASAMAYGSHRAMADGDIDDISITQ